jgi:spore coat protein U-like protein
MRVKLLAAAGLVIVCALPQAAQAQTATGNFQVLINILKACTVVSASNLDFGPRDGVIATAIDAQSNITVLCTGGTPYNIGLNAGNAAGATVTTRRMQNGTATISYQLFREAGRTTNWGNTAPTDTVGGTGSGLPQVVPVFGRVPAQNATATGAFADTITVAVTY